MNVKRNTNKPTDTTKLSFKRDVLVFLVNQFRNKFKI